MYRHGDVLLLDPVRIPETAKRQNSDVVAEGEVTGHAHRLSGGDVFCCSDGTMFLQVSEGGCLLHEEHATEPIDATEEGYGYPVIIQREYDDEKEWRAVAD